MKVRCTNCAAECGLGAEGQDISDYAYKLLCPICAIELSTMPMQIALTCGP